MKYSIIVILSFLTTIKSIGQVSNIQIEKWAREKNVNSPDSLIGTLSVNFEFDKIIKIAELYLKERKKIYEINRIENSKIKTNLYSELIDLYSSADFNFISRKMKDTSDYLFIETLKKPFFNKNLDLEIVLKSEFEKSKESEEDQVKQFAHQIKHINNCIALDSSNTLYRYRRGLIFYYFCLTNYKQKEQFTKKELITNKAIEDFNYCIKKFPNRPHYYLARADVYKLHEKNVELQKKDLLSYLDLTKNELNSNKIDYDIIVDRINILVEFNEFEKAKSELITAKGLVEQENKANYTYYMVELLDTYEKYFEEDYFKNNFVSKCIPLNLDVTKEYLKNASIYSAAEQVSFMFGANPQKSNFRKFCMGKSDKSIFEK